MSRTLLDALVTEKSPNFISVRANADLVDMLADGRLQIEGEESPLKNICAKCTPHLSDQVDEVVGLLGISKRRFLEAAIIDAVKKAHEIMEAEGVFNEPEYMEEGEGN